MLEAPSGCAATSGRVEVGIDGASDISAETIDGTIVLSLAKGLGARVNARSTSGAVENTAPAGDDCTVAASSVSGEIEVRAR